MNIKSIDLNLLKLFRVLYERPNASEAGKVLGLSQPAVSHALQRLRESFDDPLFIRGPRGLIATPRARELGPAIVKLFAQLEAALEPKSFSPAEDSGTFSIKSTDFFEQAILPSLVTVLRVEAPKLKLISQSLQGVLPKAELEQGLVDIAIAGFFGDLPNGFYQQKLFEDRFVGLVRQRHPYLRRQGLKEFIKWPQMVISPEGKLEGPLDRALAKHKVKREVILSAASFMPSGWIVQDSEMMIALPSRLARQLAAVLPVTVFDLPLDLPPIQVVQVWHEVVHGEQRHQWLRRKLFDVCQGKR